MRPLRTALLPLFLAAAAALADDAKKPDPLRFAWPAPCRANVTEVAEKHGTSARTHYTLRVTKEGADFRVHLADFEFLEFAGRPASDPALSRPLLVATAVSRAIPDLLVGADGQLKDVLDIDRAIDAVFDEAEKSADADDKARLGKTREALKSPQSRTAMKASSGEYWNAWVGIWAGLEIREGQTLEVERPIDVPGGEKASAPTKISCAAGRSPDGPAFLLSFASRFEGDNARKAMLAVFRSMAERSGSQMKDDELTAASRVDTLTATVDPATLRPFRVRRESSMSLSIKDRVDVKQIERHDWTFEWEPGAPVPGTETPQGGGSVPGTKPPR